MGDEYRDQGVWPPLRGVATALDAGGASQGWGTRLGQMAMRFKGLAKVIKVYC